ncbi:MAG: reductive dehalogenase [candidate division Zixibacteria bacterium]|nr:reductive dehalogenase [candidate division Zixibacteria bacterium]
MTVVVFLYFAVGFLLLLFLALLAVSSLIEKRPRAVVVCALLIIVVELVWFGCYFWLEPPFYILLVFLVALTGFILLFFMPLGESRPLKIGDIIQKVDERDIIFAREEYQPGTEKYEKYYDLRPENKDIDDRMRRFPELLQPGGRFFDPVGSPQIDAVFDEIEKLTFEVDGEIAERRVEVKPDKITRQIKGMVLEQGATAVGVAKLNPMYVYSHVGRGPEPWGSPIVNSHRYAIMFALEMDYYQVETAPHLPITGESARQYLIGAEISIALAAYIRSLGYPAQAHIAGSNYQIMLPPVAQDAGLGELGRLGYLISPELGPRVRLGAVTTNLPLLTDKPITFGVQDFCEKCLKCADNCPSGAIPRGGRVNVRGVEKWPLTVEKCIHYWRHIGTDCGLCMKVCPFSHPPTLVHNIIRTGLRRSSFARAVSARGDDLFYGKKVSYERFSDME